MSPFPKWKATARKRKILRERLLGGRQHFTCCWCKRRYPADAATLEHLVPLSLHGGDKNSNVALACWACNNKRGNRASPDAARAPIPKDSSDKLLSGREK